MSEEEKKAIETLKEVASDDFDTLGDDISPKMAQNIFNLIDKQQKEIEELKENELLEITENFISKDKIREKIKEQRQKYFDIHDGKHSINEICFESTKVEGAVEILKELIEDGDHIPRID